MKNELIFSKYIAVFFLQPRFLIATCLKKSNLEPPTNHGSTTQQQSAFVTKTHTQNASHLMGQHVWTSMGQFGVTERSG